MPMPTITPEQRAEALLKATLVRKERAAIKDRLKSGTVTLADVIKNAETDEVAAKTKVSELLTSIPGVGKVRAAQILERHGIAANRKVRGLGANQRAALAQEFDAA